MTDTEAATADDDPQYVPPTHEDVLEILGHVESDPRLGYPEADPETDPALALLQTELKSRRNTLRWILGREKWGGSEVHAMTDGGIDDHAVDGEKELRAFAGEATLLDSAYVNTDPDEMVVRVKYSGHDGANSISIEPVLNVWRKYDLELADVRSDYDAEEVEVEVRPR